MFVSSSFNLLVLLLLISPLPLYLDYGSSVGTLLMMATSTTNAHIWYYWVRQKMLLSRGPNVTESYAKKRLVLPHASVTFWVRLSSIRAMRAVDSGDTCGWVRGDERWSMAGQMVSHFQTSTRVGRAEYSTFKVQYSASSTRVLIWPCLTPRPDRHEPLTRHGWPLNRYLLTICTVTLEYCLSDI